jgi:hypothetical protein
MCLATTQFEPLIAEKDITVFKIVTKKLRNAYYGNHSFQYELNKLYKTDIKPSEPTIGLGLFNSIEIKWVLGYLGLIKDGELVTEEAAVMNLVKNSSELQLLGAGFHSFAEMELKNTIENFGERGNPSLRNGDEIIVECTIPKGSEYYTNPVNLFVSNQIIVNRTLTIQEANAKAYSPIESNPII